MADRVKMDSLVCRVATVLLVAAASYSSMLAQSSALEWRRVGGTVLDLSLAGPAGGPVARVWYSADGSRFFARTASGRTWQTTDFEAWQQAANVTAPELPPSGSQPAERRITVAHPSQANRLYSAGQFAYRSDDGGLNWSNVSELAGRSILGGELSDAAISPRDADEVVVAGVNGLWRSLDGGASWSGLNDAFPNLPVERIDASGRDLRILAGGVEFEWSASERSAWRPTSSSLDEERVIKAAAAAFGINVSAAAGSGDLVYAGASDGLLYFSRDRGRNWGASGIVEGAGSVRLIRVDSRDANTAVATTASRGRARVLRTTTGGVFWEDLTGNLPATVTVRGLALDRATAAIYAATDRGVYFGYADAGVPSWTLLRSGSASDVALDADGNQLYAAFDDAGILGALAPHCARDPRVVSAADRAARAAAPGSLLSVLGARVQAARIGERVAPILAATDLESQIQVPFDATGTDVQLAADTPAGSRRLGLTLLPASPSIFVDRDGVPLVMNADTGLVLAPDTPARSGSRLQILATGLGRVQPDWLAGLAAPLENPPRVVASISAYLEREPIEVSRSTLAPGYVGMYLIEVKLPSVVNRGTAELYIEALGQQSNRIRIYLEP